MKIKNIAFYLARVLSVIIVAFFAIFILEGFSPEFSWVDALIHGVMAMVTLIFTIAAWRYPRVGGWIFIALGAFYLVQIWPKFYLLYIAAVPFLTGALFLYGDKKS